MGDYAFRAVGSPNNGWSTLRQGPGEFQFNSDESSFATAPGGHVGHTARLVGSVPNVRMIITIKKRPGQSYSNQPRVL